MHWSQWVPTPSVSADGRLYSEVPKGAEGCFFAAAAQVAETIAVGESAA
jgi:hypothetical protein